MLGINTNKENDSSLQKSCEEKSISSSQVNRDLDEYDKYLKMELENFKKPASMISNSSDKIQLKDNSNFISNKNFNIDKEISSIEKKQDLYFNQLNNKSSNVMNTSNNNLFNEDFSSVRNINDNSIPDIISNVFKNISINDTKGNIFFNKKNSKFTDDNNKEKDIPNDLLASSEIGNVNFNNQINYENDYSTNENNQYGSNYDFNFNKYFTFKKPIENGKSINFENKEKNKETEEKIDMDLDRSIIENKFIQNDYKNIEDKKVDCLIDEDNVKYMFTNNNMENNDFDKDNNSYQENLEVDISGNKTNIWDNNNRDKITNSNQLESKKGNMMDKSTKYLNQINSPEDDSNFNNNTQEDKNLLLTKNTNSNISFIQNNNEINSNLDDENPNKEKSILNDKDKLSDYDNIMNNFISFSNNNLMNKLNFSNQSQNNILNNNTNVENKLEIEIHKKSSFDSKNILNEEVGKKDKIGNLSVIDENDIFDNDFTRNRIFLVKSDKQKCDDFKSNYLSFSPKNKKSITKNHTMNNSELILNKKNSKDIDIDINENNSNEEDNENESNKVISYEDDCNTINKYLINNNSKNIDIDNNLEYKDNNDFSLITKSNLNDKNEFNKLEIINKDNLNKIDTNNYFPNFNINKTKRDINLFKRKSCKNLSVIITHKSLLIDNIFESDLSIKNGSSKQLHKNFNDFNENKKQKNMNDDTYDDALNNKVNTTNHLISNPDSRLGLNTQNNKINENIKESKNNTIITNNNNIILSDSTETSKDYITIEEPKTKIRIQALKNQIEEKLREEFDNKIKEKEKEIADKTKLDFEEALKKLKIELEKNLDLQRKQNEKDMLKDWESKYENIVLECKAKLINEKETQLTDDMYSKLKPVVEKEIYKKEYNIIKDKIRSEIEEKIKKEIKAKKNEEVKKIKKKFESYTVSKFEEIENTVKIKFKEQYERDLKKELEKKEKEFEIKYFFIIFLKKIFDLYLIIYLIIY